MKNKVYEKFLEVSFICENSSLIGIWKVPETSLGFKILKLGTWHSLAFLSYITHQTLSLVPSVIKVHTFPGDSWLNSQLLSSLKFCTVN